MGILGWLKVDAHRQKQARGVGMGLIGRLLCLVGLHKPIWCPPYTDLEGRLIPRHRMCKRCRDRARRAERNKR